jgi:hypothetical protein
MDSFSLFGLSRPEHRIRRSDSCRSKQAETKTNPQTETIANANSFPNSHTYSCSDGNADPNVNA